MRHTPDPTWLRQKLIDALGANLIGLYVGEDMVFTGGFLTTWPARVGPTATTAGAGEYMPGTIAGNRVCAVSTVAASKWAQISGLTWQSVAIISAFTGVPTYVSYETLCDTTPASTGLLMRDATSGNWLSTNPVYVDGSLATTIPAIGGTHLCEGVKAAPASSDFTIGASKVSSRTFIGKTAGVIICATDPGATTRAVVAALAKTYWRY